MVVKRHDGGLIEVYGSGKIKFRPQKFTRALGKKAAAEYRRGLEQVVPTAMRMDYPRVPVEEAAKLIMTAGMIQPGGNGDAQKNIAALAETARIAHASRTAAPAK